MIDKFLVVTHVNHNIKGEKLYAYAPYVKEMVLWSKYAKKVEVIAPVIREDLNVAMQNYDNKNTSIINVPIFSILSLKSYCFAIIRIPLIVLKIFKAMFRTEHIHLRCPGNMGLLGCFVQIFFPHKLKTVKYAGNWDPNSKQPRSYRLQKWILSNTFLSRNIKVLVYGDWPNQSKNIAPFFTASFSETEKGLQHKDFTSAFKFIFVGSLSAGKRPLFAIKLIEALMGKGIPVKLEIYGSGAMKNELQEYIATKNLDPFVRLMGNIKLEELKEVYKASHFLVLASKSEGWPKAVAEAMFFGCIPIVTSVSCVPWMVDYGKRGILINENVTSATEKIRQEIRNPENLKEISIATQTWSQEYTLEKFEEGIKRILYDSH